MIIDTSKKMTGAEMNRAIRAAVAEPQAALAARFADRREAHLVDRLRRAYLGSDPTATSEDFDRALPGLRQELRRRAAIGAAGDGR